MATTRKIIRTRARIELLQPTVIRSLAKRLRVVHMLKRFPERQVWALFMFINGFISIALLSGVAIFFGTNWVFPSLGPTAFLFFTTPELPTASPRHAIYGHAIGIVCGYGALWLMGLLDSPGVMREAFTMRRAMAAALSLGATGALMIILRAAHPPAGATTLIVSLGIITKPFHLLVIEAAVAVLTVQAIAINRLAGLNYPLWVWREPVQRQ